METTIHHIAEHPEHILTLATWFHNEWDLRQQPELTIEDRVRELEGKRSKTELPMTFVAIADGELVGTYSFDLEDMTTRPELFPWLANVYVAEKFRGRGIGTVMMNDAVVRAKKLKIPRLYLFTSKLVGWYENFGWRPAEKVMYCGRLETIMKAEFLDE